MYVRMFRMYCAHGITLNSCPSPKPLKQLTKLCSVDLAFCIIGRVNTCQQTSDTGKRDGLRSAAGTLGRRRQVGAPRGVAKGGGERVCVQRTGELCIY